MSVPTAYNPKRLSDYTVRGGSGSPSGYGGSLPSGRVSGPRQGDLLGFRDKDGKVEYRDITKLKGKQKELLASYEKAQERHEAVMDKINASDIAAFDRLNNALNKSKESDPKDKLGNTVPSKQTQYLEQQLILHMSRGSAVGAQTATPKAAGIRPDQSAKIRTEGPGGPGGGRFDKGGSQYKGVPGTGDLLQRGPSSGKLTTLPERAPQKGERAEAMIGGERQQVTVEEVVDTPQGKVVKIRLRDGSFKAIPYADLNLINLSDPLPGDPKTDLGSLILGRAEKDARKRAIAEDFTF